MYKLRSRLAVNRCNRYKLLWLAMQLNMLLKKLIDDRIILK